MFETISAFCYDNNKTDSDFKFWFCPSRSAVAYTVGRLGEGFWLGDWGGGGVN